MDRRWIHGAIALPAAASAGVAASGVVETLAVAALAAAILLGAWRGTPLAQGIALAVGACAIGLVGAARPSPEGFAGLALATLLLLASQMAYASVPTLLGVAGLLLLMLAPLVLAPRFVTLHLAPALLMLAAAALFVSIAKSALSSAAEGGWS